MKKFLKQCNESCARIKKAEEKKREKKKGKVFSACQLSEMSAKDLINSAFNANDKSLKIAVDEIKKRLARAQQVYSLYNPDDRFKLKGDMRKLNAVSLLNAWGDANITDDAFKQILDWLKLDMKIVSLIS